MYRSILLAFLIISSVSSAQSLELLVGASMPSSNYENDAYYIPGTAITGFLCGVELFLPVDSSRTEIMLSGKFMINPGETVDTYSLDEDNFSDSWIFNTLTAGIRFRTFTAGTYEIYLLGTTGFLFSFPPDADYLYSSEQKLRYSSVRNFRFTAEVGFEVLINKDMRFGARYLYLGSYDIEIVGDKDPNFYSNVDFAENSVDMFAILLTATWSFDLSKEN